MKLAAIYHRKLSLPSLLILLLLLCTSVRLAIGQQASTQPAPTVQPVPLTTLYWFFLSYQQHLDDQAAQEEAKGKDGAWFRNALQKRIQFSDSDFAQIRNSAQTLVQQVTSLDAQAAAIRAEGASPSRAQLAELTFERQSAINNAIANLAQTLSPGKKAALDAFLPRFFHVTVTPSATTPSTGVRQ